MDLTPYVESLRHQLAVAAEAGGDDARALAERLTAPLDSAARLVLLDALSAATEEITRDLAPGSVEVRLRGRDPEFVVTSLPTEQSFDEVTMGVRPSASSTQPDADEGGRSRITLRLPDHLKPRIEEAADRAGMSVNAWLVRAVTAAVELDDRGLRPGRGEGQQVGRRFKGWVR